MIYSLAVLIGLIAGLRAMTAPAAVSLGAWLGWFSLAGTPLAFMGSVWAVAAFGLIAVAELVYDKRASTPSRKALVGFGGRLVSGALVGATVGAAHAMLVPGLIAGMVGAVIGTYGGAAVRAMLARGFRRDLPAALIEDAVAVGGALLIVHQL